MERRVKNLFKELWLPIIASETGGDCDRGGCEEGLSCYVRDQRLKRESVGRRKVDSLLGAAEAFGSSLFTGERAPKGGGPKHQNQEGSVSGAKRKGRQGACEVKRKRFGGAIRL